MWWSAGNPESARSDIGWLERIIARRPLRAAIICCIVAAVLLITGYLIGSAFLAFTGAFLLVIACLLLIYALIRKAIDRTTRRKSTKMRPTEELVEADRPSRQEIVARWRHRAQQKEMDAAIERAKRGR